MTLQIENHSKKIFKSLDFSWLTVTCKNYLLSALVKRVERVEEFFLR